MAPRNGSKPPERNCPTCSTPESKTPHGAARRAVEAAQAAQQTAQAAQRASQEQRRMAPQMQRPPMPMQRPQMPMQPPGLPPQVAELIQRLTQQQPGAGPARAMQQPEPAAPSSFTGTRPGQMEQEALKRMLVQRMLDAQRGGR